MRYIEIAEGLSVKVDEVEAIGYGNGSLTSKVYTHHNVYDSTFPYKTLLQVFEDNLQEPKEEQTA